MKTHIHKNTHRKIALLLKHYGVKRAAFFGSFARGEAKKNSDVDLLVEFESDRTLLDLVGLKLELEDLLRRRVDILTYDSLHPLLRKSILSEQKVIL